MRRFIAVLSALALVAVVAGPVAASKPATFSTGLTVGGVDAAGSYNGGFFVPTTGVATDPQIPLDVTNTVTSLTLTTAPYPFYLKAGTTQKADLLAYFTAKWGPGTMLDQITKEINGTDPFFFLSCPTGQASCTILDGFRTHFGISPATLTVDNDYPTGTYLYTGDLNGLKAQVKMKVYQA